MKKLKYLVLGVLFIHSNVSFGQSNDDTFVFTDAPMNYLIDISKNDTLKPGETLTDLVKLDNNNYSILIVDSTHILISDTSTNSYTGRFKYLIYNTTAVLIDTAIVTFTKNSSNAITYFNNETNSDGVVNHLDLFQVGVFYNVVGSPRLLTDTGTAFSPYKRAFWNQSNAISNASIADINGDGIINLYDIEGIEKNYFKTSGVYNPKLSSPSTINKLQAKSDRDTVYVDTPLRKLYVPIYGHFNSTNSFYGIGYSYNVKYYDKISKQYLFYTEENFVKTNPWKQDTLINKVYIDKVNNKLDVLYCKTTRQNEPIGDTLFGITEIVVDEVLIGIPNPGNSTEIVVNIFDIAVIDNNYNLISVSPINDTIIVVNRDTQHHSSISNSHLTDILVYPTLFQNEVTVRNTKKEPLNIQIFDMMGRMVHQESIKDIYTTLHLEKLNLGIYFLTIDEKNRVYKLIKEMK